ncbi:MAG: hypothetical protein AAGE18_04785 [Pseudomonadota bacterium]
MPAPLALTPVALTALRYGAVAAVTYLALRRRTARGLPEAAREDALDEVAEGVEILTHAQPGEARGDGAARLRRTIRLGRHGPGLEIDAAAFGRLRVRRTGGHRP